MFFVLTGCLDRETICIAWQENKSNKRDLEDSIESEISGDQAIYFPGYTGPLKGYNRKGREYGTPALQSIQISKYSTIVWFELVNNWN